MTDSYPSTIHQAESAVYQIRLQGHLGPQWQSWFDGLVVTLEESGNTLLSGPVQDQAALHGLLRKIRDLGLVLLLVQAIEPEPKTTSPIES